MKPKTQRIKDLITILSAEVYEKELVFKLAMLALLSGESIFLLGKPGIAKSLISRRIKYAFHEGRNFEYLMNRFSTPEEIFGPISIKELLEGNYIRVINNYLPDVDIAFLDEIWKAGPSIQNTLLTIINEKLFRNGGQDIKVPLKLLISASNELPESGKGLEALFDRFIIRLIVDSLNNQDNFNAMLQSNTSLEIKVPSSLQIKTNEYYQWLKEINSITLSTDTLDFIARFRQFLTQATEGKAYISDRRWKKITHLMKASAFYNGRTVTDKTDLLVIPYCIWDNEMQETEYTKLFNQAFLEELIYKLQHQEQALLARQDQLQNTLQNTKTLKEIKNNLSLYYDPFNLAIKGQYYRVFWDNTIFPICFINVQDHRKLLKNPNRSYNIKLTFGRTLTQMHSTEMFHLQAKSDYELFDWTKNNERKVYNIELQNLIETDNTKVVRNEIDEIKTNLINVRKNYETEYDRLKNVSSIFFDQQYQLLLETAFFDYIKALNTPTDTSLHPDFTTDQDPEQIVVD